MSSPTDEAFDPFHEVMLDGPEARLDVILVRHGQQGNRKLRDSPLTELGRRQAAEVAGFLADEPIAAVYSSNLSRAYDTGLAIAGEHGLECIVDERLREIELGRDVPAGKRWEDVLDADAMRRHGEQFVATRRWGALALGESGEELRRRVWAGFTDATSSVSGGKLVIACHGGVINALVALALGIEADFFHKSAHCSVHRLRVGANHTVMESINERSHLPGELLTY